MNSAYGSSDVPRQVPIGGQGSTPSIPPVVSSSSASNSASLDHLYHHQPSLRHPHSIIPHSPIQSQAPPHLLPQPHHFQPHQGQSHHQPPNQEREQHLPPHPTAYNTHPQQPPHSQHLQHDALSQRLDPSQSSSCAGEHGDQPHHLLDHPSRCHESFPSLTASTLNHSESQQVGSANMLIPFSKVDEITGRKYHLDVVQQPRRARMCGFGDKDRRPITPPPCVRLVITDIATGKEIDCNDIDHSMFVLNVDLWNEDGTREVNLVRSSTSSPSISSTTPYSYASINVGESSHLSYGQNTIPSNHDAAYNLSQTVNYAPDYQSQPNYTQASAAYPPNGTYGPPQQYFPQHQAFRSDIGGPSATQTSMTPFRGYVQDQSSLTKMAVVGGQPQGMFTRNLIGSLAASAFRLTDTSDHPGVWFVLQDLSVRTEGPFRLRFSFVNVGPRGGVSQNNNGSKVNTGRAPILASCFSDVFNVYSAKKFPGVCESTPLSKTFATQGIKIPIRKDANIKGGDGEDDYGD
ncbi:velvet factor domain-containing protein [Trichoderma ceciliae]